MSQASKLVAEALGTFALCFLGAGAICLATYQNAGYAGLVGVAIAHGIALSIGVSATMNISGGHVNPAVTLAMLATGRIKPGDALLYILAQLAGATIAGLVVLIIFNAVPATTTVGMSGPDAIKACGLGTPAYIAGLSMGHAILIEAALTFMLLFSIFGTAVDPRAPKIGGFGIGLTITADILLGGPLTGAAMNPARTFGPGVIAFVTGNLPKFWAQHAVYWIGPVAGALVAAFIYDRLIMEKKA